MTEASNQTVAIIGAGTMGPGMAAVIAAHGHTVRLMDIQPEVLERARGAVDTALRTLAGEGFLPESAAEAARGRLTYTLDRAEAVAGADLVIEAIPEKLELKRAFFREVEGQVGEETILASNTSGIPITRLGEVCRLPERVVGMHWSNPPHIIPVIEVVRGERTSQETVDRLWAFIEGIEMVPVLVRRDVPGFVENRILYAILREALYLLEQGIASAEDIDTVVKWGIGYKLAVIGPLELLDVAGLDIYHSVANYLNADLCDARGVSPLIAEKVAQGRLGIKTGGGLFDYRPEEIPARMQERVRRLLAVKKALMEGKG